jgi:hypothetical protein
MLGSLPTAQVEAVLAERILSQWLGQNFCNLIIGTHRKYLDETDADMLTEVMVAHVDVLCLWVKFREPGKLEGARVVFEDFAVDNWLLADDAMPSLPHFHQQFHDWNHVT